jgi:hypothetical protein
MIKDRVSRKRCVKELKGKGMEKDKSARVQGQGRGNGKGLTQKGGFGTTPKKVHFDNPGLLGCAPGCGVKSYKPAVLPRLMFMPSSD